MFDIYPIKVTLKKNNINQDEIKEQKVIILGTLNMLKNLDYNKIYNLVWISYINYIKFK